MVKAWMSSGGGSGSGGQRASCDACLSVRVTMIGVLRCLNATPQLGIGSIFELERTHCHSKWVIFWNGDFHRFAGRPGTFRAQAARGKMLCILQ